MAGAGALGYGEEAENGVGQGMTAGNPKHQARKLRRNFRQQTPIAQVLRGWGLDVRKTSVKSMVSWKYQKHLRTSSH